MIINDIEYGIWLFVEDMDENELAEEFFYSFEEMNQFIRENEDKEEFHYCSASYSIVEIINGRPERHSWIKEIWFSPLDEDDILDEIFDFKCQLEEIRKLGRKLLDETALSSGRFTEGEYKEKFRRIGDISYICPDCLNVLNECRCKEFPHLLVQIDTKILPVIRILNQKGYSTTQCCAGHPDEGFDRSSINIGFREIYDFNVPFPEGVYYNRTYGGIAYHPKEGASHEELVAFQKDVLGRLLEWAKALRDLNEDGEKES